MALLHAVVDLALVPHGLRMTFGFCPSTSPTAVTILNKGEICFTVSSAEIERNELALRNYLSE